MAPETPAQSPQGLAREMAGVMGDVFKQLRQIDPHQDNTKHLWSLAQTIVLAAYFTPKAK